MIKPTSHICSISSETSENKNRAQQLASQLHLPYCELSQCQTDWLLVYTEKHLELRHKQNKFGGAIFIDFLSGKSAHRQKYGGGKNQLIAKAVGIKSNDKPTILDVTAGLGRDAYVLSYLGCKVQMIERNPIIASLLADGLSRANEDVTFKNIYILSLLNIDSILYLQQLIKNNIDAPDIIYIDPMYPVRTKSALVKKELRILREIVGEDIDAEELLNLALNIVKKRVVVKRPKLSDALNKIQPSIIYQSLNTRYDVYLK